MATAEQQVIEKPSVVTEPRPQPSGYWDRWIGKRMVFQTKGRAIIRRVFREFRNTFLRIEDVEIVGVSHVAKPKEVMLDRNYISHFHEECELEEKAGVTGDADVH